MIDDYPILKAACARRGFPPPVPPVEVVAPVEPKEMRGVTQLKDLLAHFGAEDCFMPFDVDIEPYPERPGVLSPWCVPPLELRARFIIIQRKERTL